MRGVSATKLGLNESVALLYKSEMSQCLKAELEVTYSQRIQVHLEVLPKIPLTGYWSILLEPKSADFLNFLRKVIEADRLDYEAIDPKLIGQ